MSIAIENPQVENPQVENPQVETILADIAARTGRDGADPPVDLLRRERARPADARDVAEAIESGRLLHEHWMSSPVIDPGPIEQVPVFDTNGLPC